MTEEKTPGCVATWTLLPVQVRVRVIPDRHAPDCATLATVVLPKGANPEPAPVCPGCQPCTDAHCVVCARTHVVDGHVCPGCLTTTRQLLTRIVDLSGYVLLEELLTSGVESEAAMLAGPVAHEEAWYHRRESALAGRIPADFLEDARDERHPLMVLGTWERAWREWFGHESEAEAPAPRVFTVTRAGAVTPTYARLPVDDQVPHDHRTTIVGAAGYLDRQLATVAREPGMPMRKLVGDLRACVTYLEDVLGDAAPRPRECPKCGGQLVKSFDRKHEGTDYQPGREHEAYDDRWKCLNRDCKQWWTEEDYRIRVGATYEAHAPALPASTIARVHRVPEATVRTWAHRGHVRRHGKDAGGRVLYDVDDVLTMRDRTAAEEATDTDTTAEEATG